jgi:hypothetical protein
MGVWNNTAYIGPVHKQTITASSNNANGTSTRYSFQGCYTDAQPRTLSGYSVTRNDMTQELCVGACDGMGYIFAGVEYGSQCFCGDGLGGKGVKVDGGECGMRCKGDSGEWCGDGNRLGVWMRA